jgi:hypothetical protein
MRRSRILIGLGKPQSWYDEGHLNLNPCLPNSLDHNPLDLNEAHLLAAHVITVIPRHPDKPHADCRA